MAAAGGPALLCGASRGAGGAAAGVWEGLVDVCIN